MERGQIAGEIHFENRSVVIRAAGVSRSVQISVFALNESGKDIAPFRAGKGVKDRYATGEIHFEHGSEITGTTQKCCAVKVSVTRLDER